MTIMKKAILATAVTMASVSAYADCGIDAGRVNIIGNEFSAIQTVVAAAKECASDSVTVDSNLTKEHRNLHRAALSANPAEYTVAVIANANVGYLMADSSLRPLNDLVAEHGQNISPQQLIRVGDNIVAVAFMANSQHLMYREDVLQAAGVFGAPGTWEEVLSTAERIRSKGLMEYPIGGTYKAGWNLAQAFNNMYLGHGGEFFEAGSAAASINNAQGVATLEMMKKLTGYMNPDYLTYDSNALQAEYEAGNVAMMNMWYSRAGNILDDEGSTPTVVDNTRMAAAPTVARVGVPASTLWWDGWSLASNISDEDAVASFKAMTKATTAGVLNEDNMDQAVWLMEDYKRAPASAGLFANIQGGAKPYPMAEAQSLLHSALGAELVDFFAGNESAEQALADVEAAYTAAATEKGLL